jgi:hypothetical protein
MQRGRADRLVGIRARVWSASVVLEDYSAQAAEFMAILVGEMGEPGGGLSFEFGLHCVQQLKSLGSDVGYGLALIVATASASHQAPGLKAVHKSSDVGSAFDHALGDFAARMPLGMHSPEDSQDVILRPGKTIVLTNPVDQIVHRTGSHCQTECGFLLGIGEAGLFQSPTKSFGHGVCYSQKSARCHTLLQRLP